MKAKLAEFKLDQPWVERLDINSQPAAMAPEIFHEVCWIRFVLLNLWFSVKISENEKNNVVKLKTRIKTYGKKLDSSIANDDFKREMLFHRQAQAALLEGVARLTALGIATQRPEDYFAEMAKSDVHMHKVICSMFNYRVLIVSSSDPWIISC